MEMMAAPLVDHIFWKNRRVLLTGHTGFKGSWLALWLTELGARVTGIGLEPEATTNLFSKLDLVERLENHQIADIRDVLNIRTTVEACQPQVVFHLAAQPIVRRSYNDPLGTWSTNVQGSLHVLEALKPLKHPCVVVMVTTDKVYDNQEWEYGYRECDRLGGKDPYSASKAAAELAVASWRQSFCGTDAHQTPNLTIATARAGNVIGGGDWGEDRIIPDAMRALAAKKPISLRNPSASRPWQHVLEPLSGYLRLAEALATGQTTDIAFNFGPMLEANRTVRELITEALKYWPGAWEDISIEGTMHEARRLHLQIDKAHHLLGWKPKWSFSTTIARTVGWYLAVNEGANPLEKCISDLREYQVNR